MTADQPTPAETIRAAASRLREAQARSLLKHGPKVGKLCRPCRARQARERRARLLGSEPPAHGTPYAYGTYGCRCDECRTAVREYQRALPAPSGEEGGR